MTHEITHLHCAQLAVLHHKVRLPGQSATAARLAQHLQRAPRHVALASAAQHRYRWRVLLQSDREARKQLDDVRVSQVGVEPRLVLMLRKLKRDLRCLTIDLGRARGCCCLCGRSVAQRVRAEVRTGAALLMRGGRSVWEGQCRWLLDLDNLHCHY